MYFKEEEIEGGFSLKSFPDWSFDGSSTDQADADNSDLMLKPIRVYNHPLQFSCQHNFIVLCEVSNQSGEKAHEENGRFNLRQVLANSPNENHLVGLEQEYTFMIAEKHKTRPGYYPYPDVICPEEQGQYYCGVGPANALYREIAEDHLANCIHAGINVTGINAEVMPGQWEFQVSGDPLKAADDLYVGRFLLQRLCENRFNKTKMLSMLVLNLNQIKILMVQDVMLITQIRK